MPELPEVHTTVEGIKKMAVGKTIKEVWSDFYVSTAHGQRQSLKNERYYKNFKKVVAGAKIVGAERRGKNILTHLDNDHTIIIHMKMTGHVMVGKYKKITPPPNPLPFARGGSRGRGRESWIALEKGPLQDPYNQYIHLVLTLSDGKHLALSDMRKFASVTISKTNELHRHDTVSKLGPEPLEKTFTAQKLFEQLQKRSGWPIKSALLDQTILAGIGNIYSDEILWDTGIHPLSRPASIPRKKYDVVFKSMQRILKFSIKHGGDSKSDYRNISGEKGGFQDFHKAYGRKNQKCPKPKCSGIINRIVIKGRSSHFCPKHQINYK
jgi:formamidopyrimidine-DNA glycosylase